MNTLDMKSMFFAFLIITTFSEGRSQVIPLFLQNKFLNFLFPKDPGLVRVRRMDRAEEMNNGKVLDFIGLVEQYDYPAEEHNVTTEDGYNLKIHRIPGSLLLDNKKKKEIIFMQHGLFASSDSWVLRGPGKDLVFLLADQGYDVWIGNVRGNSYCRSHVNMTIYDPKFWQYSFHEIGTKDLPAMFDYIFNYTKQKDLYYIGHSMGVTELFTFLSSKPEYNIKIKMAICLAPAASVWVKILPAFNEFANLLPTVKEVLREHEIYDVFPQSLAIGTAGRLLCNDNTLTQFICVIAFFSMFGPDPAQLNTTILPEILSYVPAGSSVQTLEHFYQNIRVKDFRNYDYGIAENYKRYKQKTPPSYDLKKITAPIILFYSTNDVVILEENVLELGKRLPNVLLTEEVPFKLFNHVDYLWAIDAKILLYDRVLELLQKFDAGQNKFIK
ncbi:lipase 3-like isoform X1 [Temnothorax curvispinosus]|uniref:Lipase 3-like isoform X1 n=2 Tax=Temnothorax curvispinosus TaxID=300111 RepID=A0A6J1QSV5_9HYME|nr:lipase 3-like isoform X1 [Temnothorax curvispinosus]XP_024883676.1 lipase 3-like isoform X1 [Temnothorax curvispinosus]